MFDSIPPNLPVVGAPPPPATPAPSAPQPPKPAPPSPNLPHPNPLPAGARELPGSPPPSSIRPIPPAQSPPSVLPLAASGASPSAPVTLQQEHVTVMPSKFFVPPKERLPWKKIVLLVGIAVVIGLAIVGIIWFVQQRIQSPELVPPPGLPTPPVAQPSAQPPAETSATQPAPAPVSPATPTTGSPDSSMGSGQPPPPSNGSPTADVALTDAVDTDKDGLSDEEEALLGTDATRTDTDNDTYEDGKEVANLFSPNDPDVKRRIWETSAVNKYHHPVFNYELLYPAAWVARSSGENGSQIIFSSPSGEFVTVKVENNPSRVTPADWLNTQYPVGLSTTPLSSRSGVAGVQSATGLMVAFNFGPTADPQILVVQYHGSSSNVASYRTLFRMLLTSIQDPTKAFWPFSSVP